jgi:hypothetical protein
MNVETVAQLTVEADTVLSWSSLERLDDLADLAALPIREGQCFGEPRHSIRVHVRSSSERQGGISAYDSAYLWAVESLTLAVEEGTPTCIGLAANGGRGEAQCHLIQTVGEEELGRAEDRPGQALASSNRRSTTNTSRHSPSSQP